MPIINSYYCVKCGQALEVAEVRPDYQNQTAEVLLNTQCLCNQSSRPTPAAPDASPGERWPEEQGGVVELRQPEGESDITGERR